jgi:Asp-tRNA(Asn)/Glu-tRNA(Gln) amidotransferase C subunit
MDPGLVTKMRARVDQCRRLAKITLSREIEGQLLRMADEIAADVQRLEAGNATGESRN